MRTDFSAETKVDSITTRERWLAVVGCYIAMPLALVVLAGPTFFARPFWLDEVFSWLIASDASYEHSMAALAGGVDTNGPLLHLLLRGVGNVFGHTPLVYRLAMTAGMGTALFGLYLTLRRTVRAGPATVGCLFFYSLPLTITHTTEARFYGWLMAAAIWTAYGVARCRESSGAGSATLVSVASVALCGIHYFGVIALASIALADCLTDGLGLRRGSWLQRTRRLFPTLPGIVMTACLWPLLKSQRQTVAAVGTWIVNDFANNLHTTLIELVPVGSFLVLLAVVCGGILCGRDRCLTELRAALRSPLAAFWIYAAALLAFDRVVQPVLISRYFILALPALAACVASVAATYKRRATVAAMLAMSAMVAGQLLSIRAHLASPSPRSAMGIIASAESSKGRLIITDWLAYALPVWSQASLRDRLVYVPDPRVGDPSLRQSIAYERCMARTVELFYGLPTWTDVRRIDQLDQFLLLSPFPESFQNRFAAWHADAHGPIAFDMQLRREGIRSAKAD